MRKLRASPAFLLTFALRYAVRQPAAHPIYEHERVRLYRQLLQASEGPEQLALLGELMLQSHESYNACKLGSAGTDRWVAGRC